MTAPQETVSAFPSKHFFVSMLTRDIELRDAILDLLDNSLDGVQRQLKAQGKAGGPNSIEGFSSEITITPDCFRIIDNCGGIPRDVAETSAFRLGRGPNAPDVTGAIGMYGIGMKRSIFKIGQSAVVTSRHENSAFRVSISKAWMEDEDDWDLPITNIDARTADPGTSISIHDLRKEVAREFGSPSFLNELRTMIGDQYRLLINRGFIVKVNEEEIKPKNVQFLSNFANNEGDPTMFPWVYKGNIQRVNVTIVAGLRSRIPMEQELEDDLVGTYKADEAGWSVACNDRVVVASNKDRLTGWGTGGVPAFHNQFMAFTGFVNLESDDPRDLPLTTTKRGIDFASDLYQTVLDLMREATKVFTSFTNRWKRSHPDRVEQMYEGAKPSDVSTVLTAFDQFPPGSMTPIRRSGVSSGRRFVPELPNPRTQSKDKSLRRIQFYRTDEMVKTLAYHLLDDASSSPDSVGEECFDIQLNKYAPEVTG